MEVAMTQRVFLHVGTPKTGTTYLQGLLWANQPTLAEQGLLLPLGGVHDHFYLSTVARQAKRAIAAMPHAGHTAWPRLVEQLRAWQADVLISHELFAATPLPRVRWVMDELAALCDEVHVVVTARDFARQVPAEWQESVKHGRTHGFDEYCQTLQAEDPDRPGVGERHLESTLFWQVQNLPRLLADWSAGLPARRVHLVTVPPRPAPTEVLLDRFAAVLDVDPTALDQTVTMSNESLGIDEIETLRRVNALIPPALPRHRVQLLVKEVLAEGVLASRPDMRRFVPSAHLHGWMVERGSTMAEQLRPLSFDVAGDLDDLVPDPHPADGPVCVVVEDEAVARVAVGAIASLLFDRDNLATQRLIADQHRLAAELEERSMRVDELREQIRRDQGHPFRTNARHTIGNIKRRLGAKSPDGAQAGRVIGHGNDIPRG